MSEIGRGEKHVGYDIAAHLALATWFAKRERRAPSFLLLDQLSQAHFSSDAVPGDGLTQEEVDLDRLAVKRLSSLISDVVEILQGKLQVIITDYPDFSDDARFQAAFCERWRDGRKLVPDDWPAAQAVGLVCHCGAPGSSISAGHRASCDGRSYIRHADLTRQDPFAAIHPSDSIMKWKSHTSRFRLYLT